jgi:arsenate reductase
MRPYRLLFVCIGNACRSQMAEAFARACGSDVAIAQSAGLWPAGRVSPATADLMREKNIDLDGCSPKGLDRTGTDFDLIVNMSGRPLRGLVSAPVRDWDVEDPICLTDDEHREVRDRIEALVRDLLDELRRHPLQQAAEKRQNTTGRR